MTIQLDLSDDAGICVDQAPPNVGSGTGAAVFTLLVLVLALFDPQPVAQYQRWLQVPTLDGLPRLLIALQRICDSGMVQHVAVVLAARMRSMRRCCC